SSRHFHETVPPLSEATSFSVDLSPPRHPFSGADKQLPEAASQASQGAQVIGDAPAHPPAPSQASTVVQASWSSHVVPASAGVPPVHAPAAQLAPTRHGSPQAAPSGSSRQWDEQQSPSTRLPSSHCSPKSRTPFPHGDVPVNTDPVAWQPAVVGVEPKNH